ncbi:MAG: sodium:calcium antiporter [Candidatus Paceibacteria bacterium]
MTLLIWAVVFIVALAALIKGADWVLEGAQKIGLALGMSPFLVGVIVVGFGTSAPELVSSVFGMFAGATEIPAANAIGSNIANILLVIGLTAVFSKGPLTVTKNLIDLEIPLLALVTLLFFGVAYDGVITVPESVFLLAGFALYLAYSFLHRDEIKNSTEKTVRVRMRPFDIVPLVLGFIFLIGGAKYLIDAVLVVSNIAGVPIGVITILAVAVGTSLPELIVSIKASVSGKGELAVGNIFGSSIFNLLMVVGVSGLLGVQKLDAPTVTIALPMLIATTFFFIISGISNRIHIWEGAFYVLAYVFFIAKLFGFL